MSDIITMNFVRMSRSNTCSYIVFGVVVCFLNPVTAPTVFLDLIILLKRTMTECLNRDLSAIHFK